MRHEYGWDEWSTMTRFCWQCHHTFHDRMEAWADKSREAGYIDCLFLRNKLAQNLKQLKTMRLINSQDLQDLSQSVMKVLMLGSQL